MADQHVVVKVGFFDERAAFDMINAHATKAAAPGSGVSEAPRLRRGAHRRLLPAIEAALGLQQGQLWVDEMGRAFAGYAPVLSALGLLLADADNFKEIEKQLTSEGMTEARSVIEEVLDAILLRERGEAATSSVRIFGSRPSDAYRRPRAADLHHPARAQAAAPGTSRVQLPARMCRPTTTWSPGICTSTLSCGRGGSRMRCSGQSFSGTQWFTTFCMTPIPASWPPSRTSRSSGERFANS